LTIFSRAYIHWVPLTLDTSAIRLSRPFVKVFTLTPAQGRPAYMPQNVWGGTFIAKALGGATDLLAQRPVGDRMIILLSDGESADIRGGREREIIEKLRQHKITVFAINLNSGQAIEPGVAQIATATGGQVFTTVDTQALQAVFRQISEMKKVEILQKDPQVIDYFHPFFWPAVAVLVLQTLVLFGLRFNPW
jgi:Ca-activated chloride channel family protein